MLSVYSYQEELEAYSRRIGRAKSRAVRDEANEYFEALRRAIDKAEGLDMIFSKHMTARNDKYLVFCANIEHLDEMTGKVPEWFAKVDPAPRVYRAYADDPGTSKAFSDFKADQSEHLKLLFCIDMLNEGVHVEDVDGVILLRPTISPIVFKQQIGRALSASKKKDAVIFDIVNNIENLYAIGTIQQEIKLAVNYYRSLGEGGEIIDNFRVFDEVGNVRKLFERLNDTLTASWDVMYSYADAYYRENGNLEIPRRYKTPEGYSLGQWVFTQRNVYNGEQYGRLNEERIRKPDEIGMVWDSVRELSWNRYFAEAQKYYRNHGDLRVLIDYVTEEGLPLGKWIGHQRDCCSSGKLLKSWVMNQRSARGIARLSDEQVRMLEEIGFHWGVDPWEQGYDHAQQYYSEHGRLDAPCGYVCEDGYRLGNWLANQRRNLKSPDLCRRVSPEQKKRLDSIGMVWSVSQTAWEEGYEHAAGYLQSLNGSPWKTNYVSADGYKTGAWLRGQVRSAQKGSLSPERKKRLEKIGVHFAQETTMQKNVRRNAVSTMAQSLNV